MRQSEWHQLLERYGLDRIREVWPDARLHRSWIVLSDEGHRCDAIGWAVPRFDDRAVSNYAMVHLDFRSTHPLGVTDLHQIVGAAVGREDWVHIPDDDAGAADAVERLVTRMVTEGPPFFGRRFADEAAIVRELTLMVDEAHPYQHGRLETLAGLAALDGDLAAAAQWYERLLVMAEAKSVDDSPSWLVDQIAWWRRCRSLVDTGASAEIRALFADRAVAYRDDAGLPRPPAR